MHLSKKLHQNYFYCQMSLRILAGKKIAFFHYYKHMSERKNICINLSLIQSTPCIPFGIKKKCFMDIYYYLA